MSANDLMPNFKKISGAVLAIGVSFFIFVIDSFIPPGYAAWLLYFVPLIIVPTTHAKQIYGIAGLCSILLVAGIFIPAPIENHRFVINRLAGIVALWMVAIFIQKKNRAVLQLLMAQEKLKSERELLQTIIDSVPAMISIYDPAVQNIRFNNAFYKTTDWTAEDLQKTNVMELVYPDPEYREMVKVYMQSLNPGFKDFRMTTRNGDVIESLWSNIVLPDGRRVGIGIDITERKRAEKALQESETRLRLALDAARMTAWEYDPGTQKITMSENAEEVLELPLRHEGSDEGYGLIHPDDVASHRALVTNAIATGGAYISVYRHAHKDMVIWLEEHGKAIKDETGKTVRLVGVVQNITTRKQSEEALRNSEDRFRTLADNMSQFAWMADPKGWLFWYNKRWYEYTGTTFEDMQGWGWAKVHHPDHIERVVKRVQHSWDTGEYWEDTFPLRSKEGKWRWFLSRAIPIRDEQGRVVRWLGTNTDITERLRAEETLRQRTEELDSANRDLESFSYSVSHDLRNPLRVIGSFAEILAKDYADRLDDEGRDYLRRIDDGVKKMHALIDDMLSLSRVSRQEMQREDINLSAIVQNYLMELKDTEPERQAELVIQEGVHVNADPRLIHLALENLLRNAWKFTAKKQVARIEFGTINRGNQTVYFISDNGVGFDMQYAGRVFEPFMRVHAEKEFGGTGVGLSIVQRVIGRHNGKIWAEGEAGKGATFLFTLNKTD
jgi:PAS domain S-box-containing protein